jgi:hypothetical protein
MCVEMVNKLKLSRQFEIYVDSIQSSSNSEFPNQALANHHDNKGGTFQT